MKELDEREPFVFCHVYVIALTRLQALPLYQINTVIIEN